MFTGIITDIGQVKSINKNENQDTQLVIKANFDMGDVAIGASIAHSGICLTVIEKGDDWFLVEASNETLACTTMQDWQEGRQINLERALKAGDELGGHYVSGHVDGVAEIYEIKQLDGSHQIGFLVPENLKLYIATKGSVTIDGISLTVNEVYENKFEINIIPHTWENTTLGQSIKGDKVNLEVDMLARYVSRMLSS